LVNIGEEPQIIKRYIQKMEYKLPVLIDRYGQVAKKYHATVTPTLVDIDTNGQIAIFKRGFRVIDKGTIRDRIMSLAGVISAPE